VYNGVVCDKRSPIRRIAFHALSPGHRFANMGLKILRYDDAFMAGQNREEYLEKKENYGTIPWKEKADPSNGWATPFVVGHKYKIHWGMTGLDWDRMTLDVSERYRENDPSLYLVHNFTDIRAEMDVKFNGKVVKNDTIADVPQDYKTGQHVLYEDQRVREFHFVVNGRFEEDGVMTAKR
jgi:hypothetical protein